MIEAFTLHPKSHSAISSPCNPAMRHIRTNALLFSCIAILVLVSIPGCRPPLQKGVFRQSSALPDVKNRTIGIVPSQNIPEFVYDNAPSPRLTSRVERIAKGSLYGAEQGALGGAQAMRPFAQALAYGKGALISMAFLATGAAAGGSVGMTGFCPDFTDT